MKKVRMIISATVVLAIVGGSLAFKTENSNAYTCQEVQTNVFKCQIVDRDVNDDGFGIIKPVGAIANGNALLDLNCGPTVPNPKPCNASIEYSLEH